MSSTAKKDPASAALMTVDLRGRLVMDIPAAKSSGIFTRQFEAAERLRKALEHKKAAAKK